MAKRIREHECGTDSRFGATKARQRFGTATQIRAASHNAPLTCTDAGLDRTASCQGQNANVEHPPVLMWSLKSGSHEKALDLRVRLLASYQSTKQPQANDLKCGVPPSANVEPDS